MLSHERCPLARANAACPRSLIDHSAPAFLCAALLVSASPHFSRKERVGCLDQGGLCRVPCGGHRRLFMEHLGRRHGHPQRGHHSGRQPKLGVHRVSDGPGTGVPESGVSPYPLHAGINGRRRETRASKPVDIRLKPQLLFSRLGTSHECRVCAGAWYHHVVLRSYTIWDTIWDTFVPAGGTCSYGGMGHIGGGTCSYSMVVWCHWRSRSSRGLSDTFRGTGGGADPGIRTVAGTGEDPPTGQPDGEPVVSPGLATQPRSSDPQTANSCQSTDASWPKTGE